MTTSASPSSGLKASDVDALAQTFLLASRVLVGVAARSLAGRAEEITLPQFRALVVLAGRGAMRPVDLAEDLAVSSSTVTRLCDRLEAKGLLRRTREASDRRTVQLSLTEPARTLMEQVTKARLDEIGRILRAIPADERLAVVQAMEAFSRAAGEVPDQEEGTLWQL